MIAAFSATRATSSRCSRSGAALTATGRAKLEVLRGKLAAYETRLASGLSAAERAQLMGLLDRAAR